MVTNTETMISANYRNSQEALYAADAAVERVVQDLLMMPRWNDMLAGTVQSSFIDGAMTSTKTLPTAADTAGASAAARTPRRRSCRPRPTR